MLLTLGCLWVLLLAHSSAETCPKGMKLIGENKVCYGLITAVGPASSEGARCKATLGGGARLATKIYSFDDQLKIIAKLEDTVEPAKNKSPYKVNMRTMTWHAFFCSQKIEYTLCQAKAIGARSTQLPPHPPPPAAAETKSPPKAEETTTKHLGTEKPVPSRAENTEGVERKSTKAMNEAIPTTVPEMPDVTE